MGKNNPAVLLVNPWIYDFAAYDFWVKPLGLLYCASILRINGYEVYFIDCLDRSGFGREESTALTANTRKRYYGTGHFFKEEVKKPEPLREVPRRYSRYGISSELFEHTLEGIPKPEVILVTSVMTYWYPGVIHAIALCKKCYPDIPVVLGGIYATLCPEHALRYSGADYCIHGEGEALVLKKVSELTQKSVSHVPHLEELDSVPYPAFDLMPRHDSLCLLTARGCPYQCTYCASSQLNSTFRQRSVSKVINEITYWLDTYPVRDFAFYDDALLSNPDERGIPLLKGIIERDFECNFHTPNGLHIRGVTQEIAELLFQAKFKTIRLGLETSDGVRQRTMGGKVANREFEQAVTHLRSAGYESEEIGVYLMVGLPGQTAQEVKQSIHYVRNCGARPYLAEYSPIPGTRLWKEALSTSPFDLESEPLFHNNSILPCRSDELTWNHLYQLKNEVKPTALRTHEAEVV